MSQLRSDILRRKKKVAIKKSEKLYKQNHIATPIQPHETSDISNNEDSGSEYEETNIITISDNDDEDTSTLSQEEEQENFNLKNTESDTIGSTEQWVRVLQ